MTRRRAMMLVRNELWSLCCCCCCKKVRGYGEKGSCPPLQLLPWPPQNQFSKRNKNRHKLFVANLYCLHAKTQNKNTKEIISRVQPAGLRSSAAETKCVGLLAKFLITKGISRSSGDDVLRSREDDHDRTDCFRVAGRRRSISQHTLPCVILVRFLKRFRMLSRNCFLGVIYDTDCFEQVYEI